MDSDGTAFGYERAAKIQLITQDTRFSIITQIVAHPQGLPSLVELDTKLDEHKSTLYEHLQKLSDSDVVTRYEHTDEDYPQNAPRVFYGMTPTGYSIVRDSTAFDDISTLRDQYEPPTELQEYDTVPRPDGARTLDDLEHARD